MWVSVFVCWCVCVWSVGVSMTQTDVYRAITVCMTNVQRCMEEMSQEHSFKQAQSSKLVRDMEEMMSQLIKQRDERMSTEMEEELRVGLLCG